MSLTRFEECWPLPTESLPELPSNLNIVTLTLSLWPINSGVMTSLLLPQLSSSLTDSLPSLNLLSHSKTDARFMQDGRKAVWSIPYVSVAFFPSWKQNFIAYRSCKVSSFPDCIFEIHQLWQSGFSRVYSNACCSCSFEAEIIKIGQSSHKMYSNNIVNFQESTTILNTCTKMSGSYWRHHVYIVYILKKLHIHYESAYGVMIIVLGNGHSDTRLIAFHIGLIPLGKVWIQLSTLQLWVNSRIDSVL